MTWTNLERPIVRVLRAPLSVWVLLGLGATYGLYFLWPIFLSGQPMQFPQYVPSGKNYIGGDLRSDMDASDKFFTVAQTPYVDNNKFAHPPLSLLLIEPLALLGWPLAYVVMVAIDVVCVVVVAVLIPFSLSRPRPFSPLLLLALLAGLYCYGFQFELERGQANLLAVCLSFVALWIYHAHHRWRYLAYGLFCLSVQLKIYPAIFILLLVQDWRAWGRNLRRFVALGLVNVAALFVFGPATFREFLAAVIDHSVNPYIWAGNHSLRSFTWWLSHLNPNDQTWPTPYTGPIQFTGLALVVGCLLLLWLLAYRRRQTGLNPPLLLACAIAALVIPAASHDYTLSFLVAPVALLFAQPDTWAVARGLGRQALMASLVIVFSVAWGTTLVSYIDKPLALYNNCPALLVMLLAVTALACLAQPTSTLPSSSPPPLTSDL